MPQLLLDQVIHFLVCRVTQGVVLASRGQEGLHFVLGVRIEAGDVVGFVCLGAIEVLVVFRFVSSHGAAPFLS